jgi:cytochrome c oxidase assembly factor CtaG
VLRARAAAVILHPAAAAGTFAAVILATHLTGWYAAALRNPLLHEAEHVALLAGSIILCSSLGRAPAITRLVVLTVATVPMGIVGAWLASSARVRYAPYAGADALSDQALAAAIMWACAALPVATGSVALAGVALWREEQRQLRRDALAGRRRPRGAPAP